MNCPAGPAGRGPWGIKFKNPLRPNTTRISPNRIRAITVTIFMSRISLNTDFGGQLRGFGEIPIADLARRVGYRSSPVAEELGEDRERGIGHRPRVGQP